MELFMADGNYAASGAPLGFSEAVQAEIAAHRPQTSR